MLFICSLFLENKFHNNHAGTQSGPSDSPPAKTSLPFEQVLKPWVRPANTFLGFNTGLFGLPMCYTPPVKNPANPWIFVHTRMPTKS